ncbi:MAG: extracellular solute-binding protein [Anaerolineales bacterium]|nr:extracellular solute-binding protein [Anaerolineales bacterium]
MRRFLSIAISLFLLTGCANIGSLLSTPEPATVPASTATAISTPTIPATPSITPGGPRTLRIWVPPQFDPAAETPASALLQERLDEFMARRPGLQIEVRVKAESGPGNLLSSLTATRAAAPSILPDLVALSRADLEAATTNGLLHPLDGLSTLPDDPDWYPYARQMAHVQNTTVGLPFAGDAMALVGYRYPLPSAWSELSDETLFIFPAASTRALFSLSLYLSAGGTLQDSQGRPALDETIMADVFSFYLPPTENDFIPASVTTFENDEQAWNAFREQRGNLVVSWTSRYLDESTVSLALAPLPGLENGPYTLATGWSWALAGSDPEIQPLAVELAEFLSDSQFLAKWTEAAGYLPTRPTALSSWTDVNAEIILVQIAESAHLLPSQDLLATLGPLFAEATLSVLNGEQLPLAAVQSAVEQLK